MGTYEDRKKLYEGGWTVLYGEVLEKDWKEKHDDWVKRSKAKLPKWFGERPGKKGGDPESPEEDEAVEEVAPEIDDDEPEDEEVEETEHHEKKSLGTRSVISENEGGSNFLKARQEAKKGELDEQLREYIDEWRKQRSKEEEELKRLKEKQAKRKEIRAEQEKKLAQQKKEEEERLRKEEADKKAKEVEEKRKRLEEAEKKRQAMMQAQKDKQSGGAAGGEGGKRMMGGMGNLADARKEMTKTKEQLEEEKRISLSIRIKPLELDGLYK